MSKFVGMVVLLRLAACATVPSVQLRPERASIVHVGEIAELRVASSQHFSLGTAGSALILLQRKQSRDETIYLYRAVAVGNQTFVATPRDPGPDGCVSCVTVHYFANIIQ
jgi:hypothetical protein